MSKRISHSQSVTVGSVVIKIYPSPTKTSPDSFIAAARQGKLVAPLVFQGSCTTAVVDTYFKKMLLPELPQGSLIVLDNARFHPSPTTLRRVAAAGCQRLFFPPYSPALNPIEHLWATFKIRLRKTLPTVPTLFFYRQNVPMLLLTPVQ